MTAQTIGLDIGGTKVLGVVANADGTVVAEDREESPEGFADIVDSAATMIATLRSRATAEVVAVGIGIAGLVDARGVLRYGPNLPGVIDAPVREVLAARTELPVVVDNDANVAGWGEVRFGAAAGTRDALLVTLGTGIGGAIVLGGEVVRGAHGFAAELGHFTVDRDGPICACGERGHWESFASGSALGRIARERIEGGGGAAILAAAGGDHHAVNGHHVGAAAAAGDADALGVLDEYADNVALGLSGLANILDPEIIVIGGGLVTLGDLLFEPVRAAFLRHIEAPEHRPKVPIVPTALGERAGAIGAAALAADAHG
ncbi:MAG TPA: ROK family protein [Acidimicrobiia bacterium]|nr:ROK family protein [Acidimicrobiia bacterium]